MICTWTPASTSVRGGKAQTLAHQISLLNLLLTRLAPHAATDKYYFTVGAVTVTDGAATVTYELLDTYQSREERVYREGSISYDAAGNVDGGRSCGRTGSDSNDGCFSGLWETETGSNGYAFTYTPGETYPCWAPTVGNNRDNLPSGYNCGDGASPAGDACVKLWDPQVELDAAAEGAGNLLTAGIVLLVIGILFGIFAGVCYCWSNNSDYC